MLGCSLKELFHTLEVAILFLSSIKVHLFRKVPSRSEPQDISQITGNLEQNNFKADRITKM